MACECVRRWRWRRRRRRCREAHGAQQHPAAVQVLMLRGHRGGALVCLWRRHQGGLMAGGDNPHPPCTRCCRKGQRCALPLSNSPHRCSGASALVDGPVPTPLHHMSCARGTWTGLLTPDSLRVCVVHGLTCLCTPKTPAELFFFAANLPQHFLGEEWREETDQHRIPQTEAEILHNLRLSELEESGAASGRSSRRHSRRTSLSKEGSSSFVHGSMDSQGPNASVSLACVPGVIAGCNEKWRGAKRGLFSLSSVHCQVHGCLSEDQSMSML